VIQPAPRSDTEPKAYWFYGDLVLVHLSGEETGGRYSLLEWLMPAGETTPPHIHKRADQTMYVLEGELTLMLRGETIVAGPGKIAHGPMNVPHTEQVTSAGPVRFVEVNAPAGFEHFVAAAGAPAAMRTLPPSSHEPPDLDLLTRLAVAHDLEVLGPPGMLL
jgi:quercetin dioxygenase-like cupin family protein